MSPQGYARYLRVTLAKMRKRQRGRARTRQPASPRLNVEYRQ